MVRDLRIAVDIGGTFTDVVLEEGGKRLTRKLLTTPQRPEQAVLDGVRLIPVSYTHLTLPTILRV